MITLSTLSQEDPPGEEFDRLDFCPACVYELLRIGTPQTQAIDLASDLQALLDRPVTCQRGHKIILIRRREPVAGDREAAVHRRVVLWDLTHQGEGVVALCPAGTIKGVYTVTDLDTARSMWHAFQGPYRTCDVCNQPADAHAAWCRLNHPR